MIYRLLSIFFLSAEVYASSDTINWVPNGTQFMGELCAHLNNEDISTQNNSLVINLKKIGAVSGIQKSQHCTIKTPYNASFPNKNLAVTVSGELHTGKLYKAITTLSGSRAGKTTAGEVFFSEENMNKFEWSHPFELDPEKNNMIKVSFSILITQSTSENNPTPFTNNTAIHKEMPPYVQPLTLTIHSTP